MLSSSEMCTCSRILYISVFCTGSDDSINENPARLDMVLSAVDGMHSPLISLSLQGLRSYWIKMSDARQWNVPLAAVGTLGGLQPFRSSVRSVGFRKDAIAVQAVRETVIEFLRVWVCSQLRSSCSSNFVETSHQELDVDRNCHVQHAAH
jgi:hypothetical protein